MLAEFLGILGVILGLGLAASWFFGFSFGFGFGCLCSFYFWILSCMFYCVFLFARLLSCICTGFPVVTLSGSLWLGFDCGLR